MKLKSNRIAGSMTVLFVSIFSMMAVPLSGRAATAADVETVRIGVCLSLTGEFQAAGRKALAGIRMRADDFNSRSEETGVRIEIVHKDDRSSVDGAVAILEEFAAVEKVPAVIGPLSTLQMLPMAEKARELEIVLLSPTVTSPRIGRDGDWAFRLLFDDTFQGVALARYISEKLKFTRAAAIINNRLGYAYSVFGTFKLVMEEAGGVIVAEEGYEWVADEDKVFDFVPLLTRVNDSDPDVILLPVNSTEVAAIIRESLAVGVDAVFCGGDTWQHENVLLASGNNLENSFFISGIDFNSGAPAMRHYLNLFDNSHDPDAQATSVLGFDALSLIIKAMENGRDARSIKDGLYAVKNFELATGTITIDPVRGSEKTAYIHKIVKDDNEFKVAVVDTVTP